MKDNRIITLSSRHMSWLLVGIIVIALGSFGGGYFWGEKKSAERFLKRIGQEVLSDEVYSSVCSLGDTANEEIDEGEVTVAQLDTSQDSTVESIKEDQEEREAQETYYAQLIGYGTLKRAKKFVEKLTNEGFAVHIRERKSKSTRGKVISWYQVVTDPYVDQTKLIEMVEVVKKQERLHDVRIVTV